MRRPRAPRAATRSRTPPRSTSSPSSALGRAELLVEPLGELHAELLDLRQRVLLEPAAVARDRDRRELRRRRCVAVARLATHDRLDLHQPDELWMGAHREQRALLLRQAKLAASH